MPFFNCDAIVAHETSTHIRGYQGLRDSGANFGGVPDRGQPLAPVLPQSGGIRPAPTRARDMVARACALRLAMGRSAHTLAIEGRHWG